MKNLEDDKAGLEYGIQTLKIGVNSGGLRILTEASGDESIHRQLAGWHTGPSFDYRDILEVELLGEADCHEYEVWIQVKVRRGARLFGTFIHRHWECGREHWQMEEEEDYLIILCGRCQEILKVRHDSFEQLVW